MERFNVWLESLGDSAQVRVDGHRHAESIRRHLEEQGYSVSNLQQLEGTAHYLFHAKYHAHRDHSHLQRIMESLPGVDLT